ncbi:MAG: glycoside hydrolase family 13 protein [Micrococcales bacterium]
MGKKADLPMGLRPHHDGSALYVSNQAPKLLEKVKLRVRVHEAVGEVRAVMVRFSESGEAFPTPPAKVVKREGGWSWYEATITMHNPQMNYRFIIVLTDGRQLTYNALGLFQIDQPDINDFRINTFSSAPKWGPSLVMYQIFPDRWARSAEADKHKTPEWAIKAGWGDEVIGSGPGTSEQFFGGDLWGVIEHLDHLKKIGATLIYLTPIFPGRSNHRYDASSFNEVDPLLGGNKALQALIAEAHKRGFKIIGDLTSNHSGDAHEWFRAAYKKPGAPESEYYYFTNGNTKYDSWFGVSSLPKFNWKSQELRKRFIEGKDSVVAKWLKAPYGFDGWRIDVANMTGRIRDEDMYAEVAQIVRKTMVEVNPDTIMLGEYTGDAAYQVQGDGWQGAMTYANFTRPLWRWMFDAKKGTDDFQNMGYIGRAETAAEFVETHTKFAAAFPWHVRLNTMNALNTHDTPRFKSYTLAGAQRVAAGLQFTFPGIPVVWAGDEFGLDGFNGEKSRTPIPWNDERPSDRSMIETYSELAALRKKHPALVDGAHRFVFANEDTLVFVRENKRERMLVLATRGKSGDVRIPADAVTGLEHSKLVYGSAKLSLGKKNAHLEAGKMAFAVWHLPAA